MASIALTPNSSASASRWTGRVLSGLVVAFLVMDAGMKIAALPVVAETAAPLGWTTDLGFWRLLGLVLLACTALYAWPRTAVLGAILLTAYLGGTIATQLRVDNPIFSHTLFGVYLGVALWAGLWLRRSDLRALLPFGPESASTEPRGQVA